jgi:adenosylmethionine---8-amino-7-oxononanoate aminotransferase
MSLIERDKQFVWHPFTQHKTAKDFLPIVKGTQEFLIDENDNKYIDAISSWWTNLHGHSHSYIAQKIFEQANTLEHVMFAGATHPTAVALAEQLLTLTAPNYSKVFYSDNGSTATEIALKMCIQFYKNLGQPNRNIIIAFENSYHGDCFGAMSVSDRGVFTNAFNNFLFDVVFIPTPTNENIADIKIKIGTVATNACCFIYEPLVQGAGGMHMYDANLLNELLNVCKSNNIICIADEVMTGFGRTGTLWASQHLHKQPDILCLSKGITGGSLPLAATLVQQKIYDAFLSEDYHATFFHGHSYTANPIACAAALASLELLQQKACIERITYLTEAHKKFKQQINTHPNVFNARCLGTILAFELSSTNSDYINKIKEETMQLGLANGIFIRPLGNTIYLMPPYCISDESLNKLYDFLLLVISKNYLE